MVDAFSMLKKIRDLRPLVHHITNWVTIYDCANVTRALGALPVMAHSRSEVEQMVTIASALVLNIGTLTDELVEAMILARNKANELGLPIVLDAVGVGATDMRTEATKNLMTGIKHGFIKGNAGEIATIAGVEAEVKGVESIKVDGNPLDIAKQLAKNTHLTVIVTGEQDIVANGKATYVIENGHEMMGKIVGTGCMASSFVGSFAAVEKDPGEAAVAALSTFGIAGELAGKEAKGPGSFKENFYDEIFNLDEQKITKMMRVKNV